MAAVHSVHQALTKCTSQQCCQVAEFTALFYECEGTENHAGGKQEIAVVLRNYQKLSTLTKILKMEPNH